MKEYRVVWQKYPYNYTDAHVLFIEAGDETDAKAIAQNHVERRMGLARNEFAVREVEEATPVPAGRVK